MSDTLQAFDSRTPTYLEVLHDFPTYSFPEVVIDPEKYPLISSHRGSINKLFYGRYFDEHINSETLPKWFTKMQYVTDSILNRYENAFRLYKEHVDGKTDVLDQAINTQTTEDHSEYFSKSGNPTTLFRVKDSEGNYQTPESMIDRLVNQVSKNTGDNTSTVTSTQDNKMDVIGQVNDNISKFLDLENAFVEEYSNLFMKVMY